MVFGLGSAAAGGGVVALVLLSGAFRDPNGVKNPAEALSPTPESTLPPPTPTVAAAASAATGWVRTYTVESGDGYIAISQRFAVDMNEMLRLNNRTVDSPLFVGTVLRLPSMKSYVVQPGDGYIAIARALAVDLATFLRINNRNLESPLHAGDVLEIP